MKAAARGRFGPYPAYKDSGVEWLGKIPAHWEVKRLKYWLVLNPSPLSVRTMPPETEVSFVPMEAVGEYGGLDLSHMKAIGEIEGGYTYFSNGDVIVAKITPCFENGKGALADGLKNGVGFGTTELHVLRPRNGMDCRYLFYITSSDTFRRLGAAEMYGAGGQKRVPESYIENLKHPIPPLPEQRAIAAFLDRETARIDALVARMERLIELLGERRTALVTHAVTKGLDPTVPMKDSGVEWLGEIPAHWEVKRIKFVADVGNGSTPNRDRSEYWSGDYPWLNSSVVNLPFVTKGSDFVTDVALQECHLPKVRPPAILVGITGEGKTRGMATVLRIEATISQHLAFIRPFSDQTNAEYIRYIFHAAYLFLRDQSGGSGSTKGALTCDRLANMVIPFPPPAEQRAIAAFLDRETARIDALVARVREGIERLKEYRTALISAAVTGKIDVRTELP